MATTNLIDEFMIRIADMRFNDPDDFFIRKSIIRSKFRELDGSSKEMYKWYFFYQLCLLKNPLKSYMWDYLNDFDIEGDLNHEYRLFCEKRDKMLYFTNLTKAEENDIF